MPFNFFQYFKFEIAFNIDLRKRVTLETFGSGQTGKQFQFITLDIRDVNSAVTNDKNSSSKVTINFNIYEH